MPVRILHQPALHRPALDRPALDRPASDPAPERPPLRVVENQGRPAENWFRPAAFVVPLLVYVAAGALLAFRYHGFYIDAQARVGSAYYVLFSRDPHLAAVGFVWNPLPTLAVLPLLPLKLLWPAISEWGFAGNIVSATFMAGAVYQLNGTLSDLRVERNARLVLLGLFALHPLVLLYGANGMSEASLLFGLMLANRYLLRWVADCTTGSLVAAGWAFALAYLARVEAIVPFAAATAIVVVLSYRRDRKRASAVAGAALFMAPGVATVATLAGISWTIVGHPFEHFTSAYGNASQVRVLQGISGSIGQLPASFAVKEIVYLAPTLPVIAVLAIVVSVRRRAPAATAIAATFGTVLFFSVVTFVSGRLPGLTRYFITTVPLAILLVAVLLPLLFPRGPALRPAPGIAWRQPSGVGACVLALLLLAPSVVTSAVAIVNPRLDSEDYLQSAPIFKGSSSLNRAAQDVRGRHRQVLNIAGAIDRMKLRDGSVLVDTFNTCVPPIILAAKRPKAYVITNDRDFERTLADPVTFHAKYLLVPARGGYGDLDALNRAYPTLFADGAGIATLVREFHDPGCPTFRLYRVNGAT